MCNLTLMRLVSFFMAYHSIARETLAIPMFFELAVSRGYNSSVGIRETRVLNTVHVLIIVHIVKYDL